MLGLILPLLLQIAPAGGAGVDASSTVANRPEVVRSGQSPSSIALDRIVSALDHGNYDEADALLQSHDEALATESPDDLEILRAELTLARGDPAGAAKLLQAATSARGGFRCRILRIEGMAAYAMGDADTSIARLGMFAQDCTPTWREWDVLGRLLAARGEGAASRFAFESALAIPDHPATVSADYGHGLIQLGLFDAASVALARALERDPSNKAAQRDQDYLAGTRGSEPRRRDADNDIEWARRLANAGEGALHAGNDALARALYARALIVSPQYDARLLEAASKP